MPKLKHSIRIKHHPSVIALEKFRAENCRAYQAHTLSFETSNFYLANRLDRAFCDGFDAAEKLYKKKGTP